MTWPLSRHLLGPWQLGPSLYVGLEYKLQDLWIGAYWRHDGPSLDLWLCLLPTLPVRLRWVTQREPTTAPTPHSKQHHHL